jgi:3-hydroxy-9,10-secoandrosta-1,3,5(10)-triene-9,17-dione monooxygenase reductase component
MIMTWTAPDAPSFRDTLGHFASGVVVVTGAGAGRPAGLTCQSFCSVSIDPPLIAISPSVNSGSWRSIARAGHFAVSVLSHDQRELCLTFGRGGQRDKFATIAWHRAPSGAPLIHGALAWLDCRIEAVHPAGDHYLVLGRVDHLRAADGEPLLFYRGTFGAFTPDRHAAAVGRPDWTADEVWGQGMWLEGLDW